MKNEDYNLNEENKSLQEEEAITNIDHQTERSGTNDKFEFNVNEKSGNEPGPGDDEDEKDDSEYSDDEVEFADGEGTLLNEEFENDDKDE